MKKQALILTIALATLTSACGQSNEKQIITISAAASLKGALSEIEQSFEQSHPNFDLKINYGASGSLEKQIEQGAPVDIFFSAAQDKVDALVQSGKVDKNDTKILLKNQLVLVSNKKSIMLEQLNDKNIKKIAIGTPKTVPAGLYAKQALENSKMYNKIQSKLINAKDVRQVLTYVETNNVDAGFVYQSDLGDANVTYKTAIRPKLHDPITYPIAKIKATKNKAATDEVYRYITNKKRYPIFEKHGFTIPN